MSLDPDITAWHDGSVDFQFLGFVIYAKYGYSDKWRIRNSTVRAQYEDE